MQNAAPRVSDNDRDEITVTLDGKEIRGWSYESEAERRVKMRMAREFVEGWLGGVEHKATNIVADFKKCLSTMSHSRAGWDYQIPPAQRAEEDRQEKEALARAGQIWADNPDRHDDLRAAFKEAGPLASMSEIERAALSRATSPACE